MLKAGYCQIILPWNDFFKKEMYVDNNKNRNACILENMHHILEQYFNCQIQLHESLHICLGWYK